MSYRIAYQSRAIKEYEDAAKWYKERSVQAAENFKDDINKKIDILRLNPIRYRNTYKEFREARLDKFPYNIVFLIDDVKLMIIIFSIYHHKRNPKRKFNKLQ